MNFINLHFGRDKKIEDEIIKPKDNLINNLYEDNTKLYTELQRQVNIINKAEKFEKTLNIFIKWICSKFAVSSESLVRDFEKENYISLDVQNDLITKEKQKEHEEELEF